MHRRLAAAAAHRCSLAHRRRVTTAARLPSVASSAVAKFPPPLSYYEKTDVPKKALDPDAWAALQPPPRSALVAFVHRLGLASVLTSPELVQQACTHPSFLHLHRQFHPDADTDAPAVPTNAQLESLGNSLMGIFTSEYLFAAYPYLPTQVLMAAVTAYVGGSTCAAVAQEMGAAPLLRWYRIPAKGPQRAVMHTDALASVPRSITALIYKHRSLSSARQFVNAYFLSRQVELQNLIKFVDPKKTLLEMVLKFGREKPISRLLKETGRFSNSPVFVVGIFSGADKLGEGQGSSLKMAEFRAAEDALHRVYLTRTPDHLMQLPTHTFPSGGDIFSSGPEGEYKGPQLHMAEVIYASSGKHLRSS